MADNPLFPGYIPRREGETFNPLFPGYIEGQRPYKRFGGEFLKGYEYNVDYWLQQLDQMSFDIGNFPKWFVDKYIDDFKGNLKAVYNPGDTPITQMDDYDQDVFPGVSSISITLDPFEWKDPKTVLESTAKSWIKAGTGLRFKKEGWGLEAWPIDLTDYDTNVKTGLWKAALGLQVDNISELGQVGGRAIAGATRAMGGDIETGSRLFNFSDADYTVKNKKIYEQMAYNAVEAQKFIKAGQKRDQKYDTFASSMASAMAEELGGEYKLAVKPPDDLTPVLDINGNQITDKEGNPLFDTKKGGRYVQENVPVLDKKGNQIFDKGGNPLYDKQLFELRNRGEIFKGMFEDKIEAENFGKALEIFETKQQLAKDMGDMSGDIEKLRKTLQARASGSKSPGARGDITADTKWGRLSSFDFNKTELNDAIKKRLDDSGIDNYVKKIKKIDARSADAVQKYAEEYKEYLRQVRDVISTHTGDERSLFNKLSNIKVNGKELTGGGLFDPSIQRGFLRQISSDIYIPGKITSVDKNLQIGTHLPKLATLSKQKDANGNLAVAEKFKEEGLTFKGFFANDARILGSRLEMDRGSYAIEEFYDAVTNGKFMERYVWNRISKRIIGYTPGELVQKGLGKVGYFGLVMDDGQLSQGLKNSYLFNKTFRNSFQIEIDNTGGIFKGANKLKVKFKGSKDLAAVETLGNALSNVEKLSDDDLLKLITGKVDVTNSPEKHIQGFWKKMTGVAKEGDNFAIEKLKKDLDNFKKWLSENGKTVGISLKDFDQMTAVEKQQLLALFKALNKENNFYGSLKITQEFSGMLQRVGVGLNRLQDRIFGSLPFQKFLKPLLQAKTIVAESISNFVAEVITKLASKAIVAATGGLAIVLDYLIQRVLKPLVRFITRKVVEFGQNFVMAIARGDINKAMAQVDKEIAALIKFSMYAVGIPLLIIVVFLHGLFGTVLNTFSPIDPTRDNSGYAGPLNFDAMPQGENELIKIEKDVIVDGVTNPIGGLDNGAHTVYYEIRITPKVDIENTPIEITDIVTRIYKNGSASATQTLRTINQKVADSYVAGETITIRLPATGEWTFNYENSLIKNELSVTTPKWESFEEDNVTFTRYFRIGTVPYSEGCFTFEGASMTPEFEEILKIALYDIEMNGGAFLSKLCATSTYVIRYDTSIDECGWAGTPGEVQFGGSCSYSYLTRDGLMSYLLAHELGHKFYWQHVDKLELPQSFYDVEAKDGGTLPTYDPQCGSTSIPVTEDFAETVGDFIRLNNFYCGGAAGRSYEEFWNDYPAHHQFAIEKIFN